MGQLLPVLPKQYGRYYEPFLGSGALFFALKPERATLTDFSKELIGTWTAVRDNLDYLIDYLTPMKPSKEIFYDIRGCRADFFPERAAEFLYLNKTCWNGLYRVNAKGEFNVPYGSPQSDFIVDVDNLRECSKLLKRPNISVRQSDFEAVFRSVRANDLIFLDPPYVTKHNYNGFRDWNERLFRWSDQERLATAAKRLADRGAHVIVSNADHPDVIALYEGFTCSSLERSSTLASNPQKRGRVTEALFHSW